uniref:SLC3A2_N domain-containing protein n=1 Tax=Mesocestoides corti TaxID=53468 RepID=A0A0R3UF31_MESCO
LPCTRRRRGPTSAEDTESPFTVSRAEEDRLKFEAVRRKLKAWGERSTFHGIDVLMETPPDWRRVFVLVFLILVIAICWICCGKMILGFLNMSIATVISQDMHEFRFPAITICPDSPFSMEELQAKLNAFDE